MYWTLNSIYMQFECQYPESSYVSVEHKQLSRGMPCLKLEILRSRAMYCLKFEVSVARGMY